MSSHALNTVRDSLSDLTADELVRVANYVAGALASRFVSYPAGQPAPGFKYPMYDAESAVAAFHQAADYVQTRIPSNL